MLVLSRRVSESIQIGEDIEVVVVYVKGDVVRLGIAAPQKTQIWRKELWDAVVAENLAASKAARKTKAAAAPRLPVSAFSKLPQLKTVSIKKQDKD
jgi:carbon storage regulator